MDAGATEVGGIQRGPVNRCACTSDFFSIDQLSICSKPSPIRHQKGWLAWALGRPLAPLHTVLPLRCRPERLPLDQACLGPSLRTEGVPTRHLQGSSVQATLRRRSVRFAATPDVGIPAVCGLPRDDAMTVACNSSAPSLLLTQAIRATALTSSTWPLCVIAYDALMFWTCMHCA
jgi:hypothetical protein